MGSIVLEIQREAVLAETDIAQLLRKTLLAATKLRDDASIRWINKELTGYDRNDTLPPYRTVQGRIEVKNPYHGWQTVLIPDNDFHNKLTTLPVIQPITEIWHLVRDTTDDSRFEYPIPPELAKNLMNAMNVPGLIPQRFTSREQLNGIIDAVRKAVLEWALKLEIDGIRGDDLGFSEPEITAASHITYNITSFTGIAGSVHGGIVQIGDSASLVSEIAKKGLDPKELDELNQILRDAKSSTPETRAGVLSRAGAWIGRNAVAIGDLGMRLMELLSKMG